jgi:LPS O-antigen subunit length determinant protein (WzzB/FepE family)
MQSTNLKELKDGLSQLMQSQMQNLMLASVSDSYIYKVINSPIAPERKSAPSRAFICIFGTFIGFLISSLFSLLRYYKIKGNA